MSQSYRSYNLNASVRVKLTEKGAAVLGAYQPEAGGTYECEFWRAMHIFGRHLHLGSLALFENNCIEIETAESGEIEKMREMIRKLADMLDDQMRSDNLPLQCAFIVRLARRYLSGPAYDFADPAQRREERNTGTSE